MPDHTAHFTSYGVPFRLRASSAEQLQHMIATIPHGSIPQQISDPQAQEFTSAPEGQDQLRTDLMVHVANFAPDHIFLHAGVVAHHGRAIVLPGQSFAGKTTLVAALVRAGALYYSDEYAVLTPAGLIHPYARSLQVRAPGSTVQTAVPIAALNGHAGSAPVPAGVVALLQYVPQSIFDPQPVTPGMAVLEMLRHTIPVQRTPARVLAALTALVAPARLLSSPRGEAHLAAHALLELLEQHP